MKREFNDLSERHLRQVRGRNEYMRQRMYDVIGVAWRPGGNSSSFTNRLYRPLGAALMMSQVSYSLDQLDREGIALFGIAADIDPHTAEVHYSVCKLSHDFHRVPFVGARGGTLDPSPDRRGPRGNGNASWVQLALEVDKVRANAAERKSWSLRVAPELPEVMCGFGTRENIRFEITPQLRRLALVDMELNWTGNGLQSLSEMDLQVEASRGKWFDALPAEEQETRLRAAWENAIVPPETGDNTTGMWLLSQRLCTNVFGATRVFEYFGGLVGAHVFNPARKLGEVRVANPAVAVAKEAGFDLEAAFAMLQTEPAETATEEEKAELSAAQTQAEEAILGLVPAYRKRLGNQLSAAVDDQALVDAIITYADPVMICPALDALPEADQVAVMRRSLKPHVSEACSDEDLISAAQNPNSALFASGLAKIQVLHRQPGLALVDALRFGPAELERPRLFAQLWYEAEEPPVASAAPAETPEVANAAS